MSYPFGKIEKTWQKEWVKKGIYEPNLKKAKRPFYNLMMFPYPSAEGLHVGNMYAFTGSDVYGRMKRMQGYDVFEPIGLDGFGIHSENYAIKIGTHPMTQAKIAEKRFYKQLESIGNGFAWKEHVETYDPEYYRWTQWIFLEMWKRGLAYRKKQQVNWCPSCKTVLADEQVIDGKCERCSTVVIKKELEQWFFKITQYADRLLKNIETLDWSDKVRIAQRNWIGRSDGALITFPLTSVPGQPDEKHSVEVFTTRPDTLFGVTFVAISAELARKWLDVGWQASDDVREYVAKTLHEQAKETTYSEENEKEKTGVPSSLSAVNPATKESVPVWIVNYVMGDVGTGAIMGVPAHDARDMDFAKKYNLPVRVVIDEEKDVLVRSGRFDGVSTETAKKMVAEFAGGKMTTKYRLRDWLISRQRYWGAPIPMIFCPACAKAERGEHKDMPGWYAVSEKQLPVKLPFVKDFRPLGEGHSPLANVKSFHETKCPSCHGAARRETDVSDTFLDSAWYYLRYLDITNTRAVFDKARVKKWLPAQMYIGGAEHSVLHLLYVRFVAMVLHDAKLVLFDEPFTTFRAHGLLIKDGAKMSKSKGNVVNPDEYVKRFGADALRTYLMFLAPFEQGGDFRDQGMLGVTRFLDRAYAMGVRVKAGGAKPSEGTTRVLHKTIKKVSEDIENLRYNTAVSALMILLNTMEADEAGIDRKEWELFVLLLAPFAPHLAEELWHMAGNKSSVHRAKWPKHNPKLVKEETISLVIQINGKTRHSIIVPTDISEEDATKLALAEDRVKPYLEGKPPRRVIYVPGRIINIVI